MKILFLLLILPFTAFGQGYFSAGYSASLPNKKLSSGVYFGAGYQPGAVSFGFQIDCMDLNYKNNFGMASADIRYNYGKAFLSGQFGKVLYEDSKAGVKGTYSYSGMLGYKYWLLTIAAGYQNTGFKAYGVEGRAGFFKAMIGIELH